MIELLRDKWDYILNTMREDYDISEVSFKTWFLPLKVHSVKDNTVYIVVENDMVAGYMSKKYLTIIQFTISEVFGEPYDVVFIPENKINESTATPAVSPKNSVDNERIMEANLNPKYTFDTFVVGGSNTFAHAYALRVAESPAEEVNPLFLYGGVGLGKTHLMQSIGHYILEHNKDMKVNWVL